MTRIAFAVLLVGGALAQAGDPELVPVRPQISKPAPVESMSFVRQSMYDRWQYLAVDRGGYFRPRVVLNEPCEPFYLYNGKPYPWMSVRPRDYIPYVTD